ncbi:MAG: hypothetical protein GC204_05255 [Chloroflexi bacterium]|nr:hypothetical protein [Chloroflexota bacterium]
MSLPLQSTMRRSWITHLAVYGFYLLAAVMMTYPLITQLSTVVVGFVYGDGYEMAHHLWWFAHALQTGQTPFYQSLLAYPNGIEGITLWAYPLQLFPAWLLALVLPLMTAANVAILITLAANGWAMFWLVRYLVSGQTHRSAPTDLTPQPPLHSVERGREERAHSRAPLQDAMGLAPALLAGLVFMLYPTMQGHLGVGHVGQLVQWPVPLYVYSLYRLRERGGWKGIALTALLFFLSAGGHTLQVVFVLLPVAAVYGLLLLARREWTALRRSVIGAGLGAICLLLFLLPVLQATLGTTAYTDEGGSVRYSADLLAVVTPSFRHPLFDRLDYTRQVLGVNLDEGAAYVGIIAALLGLIALWKVKTARGWLLLALVAWVLSLGPLLKIFDQPVRFSVDGYASYITLPFALIANLPLISLARTPGRFDFVLALAVAVLAGYGAAYLWQRIRVSTALKWIGIAVLMAGIAFEYQVFWPLPLSPAAIPQAIADIGSNGDVRAVFDVPWDNLVAAKDGMYLQTGHHLPLIAGHETRSTPVSPAKLTLLQTFDPALLRSVGADAVIVHKEQDGDGSLEALAREKLGDPTYEDGSLALFMTPKTDALPRFMALPSADTTLTTQADSYVYAPEDSWLNFSATLNGEQREVTLLVDGMVAQRWSVNSEQAISVPLRVNANSFTTIALALDPACPNHYDAALECRSAELSNVKIEYAAAEAAAPVTFDHGVTLAGSHVPEAAQAGGSLGVWLDWTFDQSLDANQIRFVHVTDAAGTLVAQQDNPLGTVAAGEGRAESVEIALPGDLPPGDYSVSVGWYSYPAIENFCVLTAGSCGEGFVTVGTVKVG